jgi:hypothetical protein
MGVNIKQDLFLKFFRKNSQKNHQKYFDNQNKIVAFFINLVYNQNNLLSLTDNIKKNKE